MLRKEYSQTQFLDNISSLEHKDVFNEKKDCLELIEFVIEEQTITDDIIDKLDMSVIVEAIKMICDYDSEKPTINGNDINLLNEMMMVHKAKSVLASIRSQRVIEDLDFF